MSFNLTSDENNHENQMSLFDFKRPDLDFAKENPAADKARLKELIPDISTAVDYHHWKMAHAEIGRAHV